MKLSNLLIFSIFCIGCNQSFMDKAVDKRPANELALIKRVGNADSVYTAALNNIKKSEAVASGKPALAKFISDTLHSEVKNWQAVIYKMDVSKLAPNTIELTLLIPQGAELNEKTPAYNAIALYAQVSFSDVNVKNSLASMQVNDKVFINGSFEKDDMGKIDVTSDEVNDDYLFNSLKFNFHIDSVTK